MTCATAGIYASGRSSTPSQVHGDPVPAPEARSSYARSIELWAQSCNRLGLVFPSTTGLILPSAAGEAELLAMRCSNMTQRPACLLSDSSPQHCCGVLMPSLGDAYT